MESSDRKDRDKVVYTWKANYLSIGGMITLIKLTLSNQPVYYFSLFKCPVSVIKRLKRLQREFLWHGNSNQKKFHLVDWDSICKPKESGGLGIRSLKKMNQTLFGKWLWRIGDGMDGLWREALDWKYSLPRRWAISSWIYLSVLRIRMLRLNHI